MTKGVIIAVAAFAYGLTYNDQTPVDSTIVKETDTTITNDDLQGSITRGN
jgi:hypothetical protein